LNEGYSQKEQKDEQKEKIEKENKEDMKEKENEEETIPEKEIKKENIPEKENKEKDLLISPVISISPNNLFKPSQNSVISNKTPQKIRQVENYDRFAYTSLPSKSSTPFSIPDFNKKFAFFCIPVEKFPPTLFGMDDEQPCTVKSSTSILHFVLRESQRKSVVEFLKNNSNDVKSINLKKNLIRQLTVERAGNGLLEKITENEAENKTSSYLYPISFFYSLAKCRNCMLRPSNFHLDNFTDEIFSKNKRNFYRHDVPLRNNPSCTPHIELTNRAEVAWKAKRHTTFNASIMSAFNSSLSFSEQVEEHSKKILSFLNRITSSNFDEMSVLIFLHICDVIQSSGTGDVDGKSQELYVEVLRHFINDLYSKAVFEKKFVRLYASLCKRLDAFEKEKEKHDKKKVEKVVVVNETKKNVGSESPNIKLEIAKPLPTNPGTLTSDMPSFTQQTEHSPVYPVGSPSPMNPGRKLSIRNAIIEVVQKQFESNHILEFTEQEKNKLSEKEMEEKRVIHSLKMRGNAVFVGELLNIEVLQLEKSKICIDQLLSGTKPDNPIEENLLSLAYFLTSVGHTLSSRVPQILSDTMKKIEFISGQGKLKNLTKFALLDVLDAYREKRFPQYEIPIYVAKGYSLYNSEFYTKYSELINKGKINSPSLLIPKGSPVLKGETPPSIQQAYQSSSVLSTKSLNPYQIKKQEILFIFISNSPNPLAIPTAVTNLINSVRDIINNRETKKVSVFSQMLSLATTGKIEGKNSVKNAKTNDNKVENLITMMSAYRFVFSTVLGECAVRGDSCIDEIISTFVSCIPSIRMDWGCAIIEALIYIYEEAKELQNIVRDRKTSLLEDSQRALSNAKFNVVTNKTTLANGRGKLFEIFCSVDELPCMPRSLLLHPTFSQSFEQLAVAMIGAMITDESMYLAIILYNI
jgi:hypothetical protein